MIRAGQDKKQRIVIKLTMKSPKDRSKAMTIATKAAVSGNVSVKFEGEEKDKLVVIGNRVDHTALMKLLRKKVDRHASLEEVKEVEDIPA
ncbi:disease resistance protein RGA5-like isoform X2 [Diospyros lotus]|uniref:disease resistance protein RGA5-like isoform X1 n=1 Tax=Diospyros lotus TaxID=55363 RepID=UPI00224DADE2|nr:disease resistance protein RGA5-like isoform X1 [Diospyros lotus]XP_052177269.1 disease resistance protein RGA5-like isoform X2 [Diospyros lotus]